MKRFIWLPIAGFLLVAGATVAAAAPGIVSTASSLVGGGGALALDDAGIVLHANGGDSLLDEVLAELVTDGVITQEQSDAISDALATRHEERRAEFEAEREQLQAMWEQIRGFLEDGVISADEIAQLPEDNPFSAVEGILEDGEVTLEELQSLRPFGGFREGPGFGPGGRGGHHGHGPRMWAAPADPGANPDTTDPNLDPTAEPTS